MRHIAVIDIGKTNAKLALVDAASLTEVAVVTRPNTVKQGPPWPHFDVDGHWRFILDGLAAFQRRYGVDAIAVTTHGAAAVFLTQDGQLAAPVLDYEHRGPEQMAADYDALRPPFAETGSPRLAIGLNLGAQLHWQLATDPALRDRTAAIVTYPQYWGFRLTGELACDLCSLGCHTDLWNPWERRYSGLVDRLGLEGVLALPRPPSDRLGGLLPDLAAQTGVPAGVPVSVGIHDSNASLYPHLRARSAPFAVVSTGTWVVVMAIGAATRDLDPARDVLVNVDALGAPVPSARFMGGREFDLIAAGTTATVRPADRAGVLADAVALLPAVEPASGPFAGQQMHWTTAPRSDGERQVALSWYLALMTQTCLTLTGARGPAVVEGPFARNPDFLDMLASLWPGGVETTASATGTAIGAALLLVPDAPQPESRRHRPPADRDALVRYAGIWAELAARGRPLPR